MKVRVRNRLIISDPSPAVKAYCEKNLILDNPDYYKLERMGKWTGNTPTKLWLYEVMGDELWLPFGCIQDIWKIHPVEADYSVDIASLRACKYDSHINLYPYQEQAVTAALRRKNGVLVMPCGSGKTQCGLEIIARVGGRALWLTHTQDLLNQSKARAEAVLNQGGYGTITAGKVNVGSHITFATVQTLAQQVDMMNFKDDFDVVICDECMPGNTLIDTPDGKKELRFLSNDDIVTSYNRTNGIIEDKRITHIFKNKAHDIVVVNLESGEKIICTKNHPVFTGQWIDAERLVKNDYVLRLVRQRSKCRCDAENNQTQSIKKGLLLLFKGMFNKRRSQKDSVDRRTPEDSIRNDEKNKWSISRSVCRAFEKSKSDEKCRDKGKSVCSIKSYRTSSEDKMWKWNGVDGATTKNDDCTCSGDGCLCGIPDTDKDAERQRLSDLLQGGYCNAGRNDCDRNRRQFSSCNRTSETGSEKNGVFEWIRVESVTVQEQTSDGTFGGLCPDGYVYNIEVEDNNNYFANGILVHNCQHAAGTPTKVTQFYKVISRLSARYKIGLTATPKRADGLQAAMFALLGPKIHEVTRMDVAHTTCPVKVQMVETGYVPDYEAVLMGDGTIDYSKVINHMIHDENRYNVVFEFVKQLHSVMVLGNRVEYLQRMCEDAIAYGKRAVCLSGQGQSKRAKAERKAALEKLNNDEIDVIFCTYLLAAEGLDIPNLRYVLFSTPEKNEVVVQQASGRVGRKAEGKSFGVVVDFVDDFGMYENWYRQRKKVYNRLNYDIIE